MKKENRSLFCLNWAAVGRQMELNGFQSSIENYQFFSFDLVPCNYIHSYLGYQNDSIAEGCISDRKAQEEYLGDVDVTILISQQNFIQDEYGEKAIRDEAIFISEQMSKGSNHFMNLKVMKNLVEDESSYLQFGQYEEHTFYTVQVEKPQRSAWNTFPTAENPGSKFKYIGVDFWLSPNMKIWTRETYSILDFLGDMGGLYDALYLIL